jgi:hypothetical protein
MAHGFYHDGTLTRKNAPPFAKHAVYFSLDPKDPTTFSKSERFFQCLRQVEPMQVEPKSQELQPIV